MTKAEVGGDAGVCAVARAPVAPSADLLCSHTPLGRSEREAQDKWRSEQREHGGLYVLRDFLRSHYDERGLKRLHGSCLRYYWQYRHAETGATKLCPGCCHERAICPHCAVNYGKERGSEVASLFNALLEVDRLLGVTPQVKAFAEVFTLPDFISIELDTYAEAGEAEYRQKLLTNPKTKRSATEGAKLLRKAVQQLTEALKRTLMGFYGSGVAAKVSWHWWHSSMPLTGPHWHAHVMMPNIVALDSGHEVLRARGMLNPEQIETLKTLWAKEVNACRFVASLGYEFPNELTVNHKFLTNKTGKNSIAHRARYDYRHPMQDFTAWVEKNGLPELEHAGLAWFLDRCEFLQGVQLVRSIGWLSNPKVKKLGLQRAEPENDGWVKDMGVVFELDTLKPFDEKGAWFIAYYSESGRYEARWFPRESVQLVARPKPRRYEWVT